jgi:beta-lactamase regulating signal transducer with metallopeptidase domain
LSALACAVYWFNPIVWLTCREIDRACELSCDEAVIRDFDARGRRSYGETLLYVAVGKTPRAILSATVCEEKRDLKERLSAIMKAKKRTRVAVAASVAVVCIAVLAVCVLGAGSES